MIVTINGRVNRTSPVPFGDIVEDVKDSRFGVANALREVKARGLKPLTSPRFLDLRIDCPDFKDPLWIDWYTTASGVYKVANNIVVVHGLNHPLTDSERVRSAVKEGLVNYGAKLTDGEAQAFVERKIEGLRDYEAFLRETEDKDLQEQFGVVADVSLFRGLSNDNLRLAKWVKDPRTIMLSGGKKRAELYAERLDKKGVKNPYIGLDVQEGLADRGLLVFACGDDGSCGLGGGYLGYSARFVGELVAEPQSVAQKTDAPLESRVEVLQSGRLLRHDGRLYVLAPEGLEVKQ